MYQLEQAIRHLFSALTEKHQREQHIREFQSIIWKSPEKNEENPVSSMLDDLAYDLDYYEPSPKRRRQSHVFFGDDDLEKMIKARMVQLKGLGVDLPIEIVERLKLEEKG